MMQNGKSCTRLELKLDSYSEASSAIRCSQNGIYSNTSQHFFTNLSTNPFLDDCEQSRLHDKMQTLNDENISCRSELVMQNAMDMEAKCNIRAAVCDDKQEAHIEQESQVKQVESLRLTGQVSPSQILFEGKRGGDHETCDRYKSCSNCRASSQGMITEKEEDLLSQLLHCRSQLENFCKKLNQAAVGWEVSEHKLKDSERRLLEMEFELESSSVKLNGQEKLISELQGIITRLSEQLVLESSLNGSLKCDLASQKEADSKMQQNMFQEHIQSSVFHDAQTEEIARLSAALIACNEQNSLLEKALMQAQAAHKSECSRCADIAKTVTEVSAHCKLLEDLDMSSKAEIVYAVEELRAAGENQAHWKREYENLQLQAQDALCRQADQYKSQIESYRNKLIDVTAGWDRSEGRSVLFEKRCLELESQMVAMAQELTDHKASIISLHLDADKARGSQHYSIADLRAGEQQHHPEHERAANSLLKWPGPGRELGAIDKIDAIQCGARSFGTDLSTKFSSTIGTGLLPINCISDKANLVAASSSLTSADFSANSRKEEYRPASASPEATAADCGCNRLSWSGVEYLHDCSKSTQAMIETGKETTESVSKLATEYRLEAERYRIQLHQAIAGWEDCEKRATELLSADRKQLGVMESELARSVENSADQAALIEDLQELNIKLFDEIAFHRRHRLVRSPSPENSESDDRFQNPKTISRLRESPHSSYTTLAYSSGNFSPAQAHFSVHTVREVRDDDPAARQTKSGRSCHSSFEGTQNDRKFCSNGIQSSERESFQVGKISDRAHLTGKDEKERVEEAQGQLNRAVQVLTSESLRRGPHDKLEMIGYTTSKGPITSMQMPEPPESARRSYQRVRRQQSSSLSSVNSVSTFK